MSHKFLSLFLVLSLNFAIAKPPLYITLAPESHVNIGVDLEPQAELSPETQVSLQAIIDQISDQSLHYDERLKLALELSFSIKSEESKAEVEALIKEMDMRLLHWTLLLSEIGPLFDLLGYSFPRYSDYPRIRDRIAKIEKKFRELDEDLSRDPELKERMTLFVDEKLRTLKYVSSSLLDFEKSFTILSQKLTAALFQPDPSQAIASSL